MFPCPPSPAPIIFTSFGNPTKVILDEICLSPKFKMAGWRRFERSECCCEWNKWCTCCREWRGQTLETGRFPHQPKSQTCWELSSGWCIPNSGKRSLCSDLRTTERRWLSEVNSPHIIRILQHAAILLEVTFLFDHKSTYSFLTSVVQLINSNMININIININANFNII